MTEVAELVIQITGVCAIFVILGGMYSIRQLRQCSRVLRELKYSTPKK
jgi:hypothetical protein